MAVNCFGSGVPGLSVHASMHTPPIVDFWRERKNDHQSPHVDILLHLRPPNSHPCHCCSSSRRELLLLLTHIKFRVLSVVVVHPRAQEDLFIPQGVWLFLSRIGVSGFSHVVLFLRNCGCCGYRKSIFSLFLYVVFVCFLSGSISQDELYSPCLL